MADTEKLEFYKEGKDLEKIVKEKKIEREIIEQLAKEIANVVSSKSEYKQIVVWWNVEDKWDCTFRTQIIPLSQTCAYKAIGYKETPLCLSFEYGNYGNKEYWVMRVEKVINEKWNKIIKEIRNRIRDLGKIAP